MAKGEDPLENRSEYHPPTSPPKARIPSKRDYQSVKLDPTIDRRRAKTQISQRQMARASRSYTMTAFIAGALGALTASGVYLAMNSGEEVDVKGNGEPVRQGVTTPATTTTALGPLTATVQPGPAGVSSDVASAGTSTSPSSAATVQVAPGLGNGTPTRRGQEDPTVQPRPADPVAPQTSQPAPQQPPQQAAPTPSASGKAWVDVPPRKVWVP